MGISIERFIIGAFFILLFVFSIILLLLKRRFVQSRDMHRYLGASCIVSSLALLYMYVELLGGSDTLVHILRIFVAAVCIVVYLFITYKVVQCIIARVTGTVKGELDDDELPMARGGRNDEDDDTEATDEDGNPIPEPSADNMEDLIFFQKLESIMATKRLFSDPDITREQVAMEVGTNRTYLIRSIKLATGKTFNEYLTDLRVNYAATLLVTSEEPLDYIGTMAGFRSRSVYYRAFAAANSCSPSEYRNRNKQI